MITEVTINQANFWTLLDLKVALMASFLSSSLSFCFCSSSLSVLSRSSASSSSSWTSLVFAWVRSSSMFPPSPRVILYWSKWLAAPPILTLARCVIFDESWIDDARELVDLVSALFILLPFLRREFLSLGSTVSDSRLLE